MQRRGRPRLGLLLAAWLVVIVTALSGLGSSAVAQQPALAAASALHAKRQALQPKLRANSFGQPLVLSARETSDRLEGDVYAEVAYPFAAAGAAFRSPAGMCEMLFLHLNVRACTPSATTTPSTLSLLVGPKRADALGAQYRMRYAMRSEVIDATLLRVTLSADDGPLSTWDYRMVFEAVPIDSGRSFVHFGYAYSYGLLAKLAMGAYLATAGSDKIGFTVEGKGDDGRPLYIHGQRAAVERNVMRYYLAILAYLSVDSGTHEQRLQARLRAWFALTERYAAQLHEYDLAEYLREKNEQPAPATAAD